MKGDHLWMKTSSAAPASIHPHDFESLVDSPISTSDSYFDGANASGKPIVAVIGALLLLGYSLEYQHLKYHKNNAH